MAAWDLVEILGIWLAYGGVNSMLSLRDKRLDRQSNNDEGDISI